MLAAKLAHICEGADFAAVFTMKFPSISHHFPPKSDWGLNQ